MTKIESLTKLLEPQAQVIRGAMVRRSAGLKAMDDTEAYNTVRSHCFAHGFDIVFYSSYKEPAFTIVERPDYEVTL